MRKVDDGAAIVDRGGSRPSRLLHRGTVGGPARQQSRRPRAKHISPSVHQPTTGCGMWHAAAHHEFREQGATEHVGRQFLLSFVIPETRFYCGFGRGRPTRERARSQQDENVAQVVPHSHVV